MILRFHVLSVITLFLLGTNAFAHGLGPVVQGYNLRTANLLHTALDFREEDVIRNGDLIPKWASCADGQNVTKCYMVQQFQDRLSFTYTIDRNYDIRYVHYEPVISVVSPKPTSQTSSIANPVVKGFVVDDTGGRFTVLFQCDKTRRNQTVLLELEVSITPDVSRSLRFYKSCGSGYNPYVHAEATLGGVIQPLSLASTPVHVPVTEDITKIRLSVHSPALAQAYGAPILTSSNPAVKVELRGMTKKGTIISGIVSSIMIIYTCDGRGNAIVSLIIPIPPWDDVFLSFQKRCGKTFPQMLQIKTVPDSHYVAVQGLVLPHFNVSKAELSGWDPKMTRWMHHVSVNATETSFTIENNPVVGQTTLYIESVVTTVVNSSVATATVVSKDFFGNEKFKNVPLLAEQSKQLVLRFRCLRKGHTLVLVSIQLLQYRMIEFGFTKNCNGKNKSKLVSVLHRLEWAMLAIAVSGLLCLICTLWRRRSTKAKFSKLRSAKG